MALILHEKYVGKNGSYWLFWGNRFLRIYPLYWSVLVLSIVLSFVKFTSAPASETVFAVISRAAGNSSHVFGNIAMIALRNITLIFTTDYWHQNFHNPAYLLLLPAWTLQIELLFYLLSPYLIKLKTILLISLAIPFGIISFSNVLPLIHSDLSITYIFLNSFIYFILGMISYQLYRKIKPTTFLIKRTRIIFTVLLSLIIVFGFMATQFYYSSQIKNIPLFYYLLLMASIPFIFYYSKNKRFDAAIGDLSYPVYLSHVLIFKVISYSPLQKMNHNLISIAAIAGTLVFSYVLVKLIEKPIDTIRSKRLH